jgi:VWFA-related protein
MRRAAIAFLIIPALLAQQAADQPPVVLKSTTRLVQVSVIAQDGKGQPVTDLKKDDFRIKVNGKDQPIKIFSMDSAGLPKSEEKLPLGVFTNRMANSGQQSSITIVLLDTLNTTNWTDQVQAKAQVIRYLRTLQPSDHIGLYTLGTSLRVLHDYTEDSSDLLSRIDAIKGQDLNALNTKEPTDALHQDALMLDFLQRRLPLASASERDFYNVNRILGTLKALEFIANHLAKTPGRKNLIWVSGGFPLTIGFGEDSMNSRGRVQTSFTEEISETVRAVNDANMAVYPVDARGLMAPRGGRAAGTWRQIESSQDGRREQSEHHGGTRQPHRRTRLLQHQRSGQGDPHRRRRFASHLHAGLLSDRRKLRRQVPQD